MTEVFYVGSTAAWRQLAENHLNDEGVVSTLSAALITLVDAYEHARSETESSR